MKLITFVFIGLIFLSEEAATGKELKMQNAPVMRDEIQMRVGSHSFAVTLLENETTQRLRNLLPLTIRMADLNNNEKYYDLPKSLPANASHPGTIRSGDLMLYGSNTLVIFYKTFASSYSYTRLGQVRDPSNLESALGSGAATVILESK